LDSQLVKPAPLVNRKTEVERYARLISPTRLAAVEASGLLDGNSSEVLDRISRLVTRLVGAPMSVVSLVGRGDQFFPGMDGLTGWPAHQRSTPLSHSYCQHVVMRDSAIAIANTSEDPIAAENAAYTELGFGAYAGVPLRTSTGETLGALCAINTRPWHWTSEQMHTLEDLAAAAMSEIELRATARALLYSNQKLAEQVVRDPVTGLLNRTGFLTRARAAAEEAQHAQRAFIVCLLDLNHFRHINHSLGFDAADAALVETAALLEGAFRDADVIARIGSDEFVVLIDNASESDIPYVTARLAASFDVHNASRNRDFVLDASVGFAAWNPRAPVSVSTLLQRAEVAMRESRSLV
jgi:diguanylate cyclase (GGDEF)-like protein